MRRWVYCFLFLSLVGCNFTDRGLIKLQVVDELYLGTALDEIKQHWFLYSLKPLQVDQSMSNDAQIVYRGVSRDLGVTSFYLFFNTKTKMFEKAEWRYHSSMTETKEQELLDYWTKKLWEPSLNHRWEGRVYVWSDRKARLELYLADGICHLIQRIN